MKEHSGLSFQNIINGNTTKIRKINMFEESVDSFSSADIRGRHERDRMKTVSPLMIRSVVMTLILGIFLYCVYLIAARIKSGNEQETAYGELLPKDSAVSASKKMKEPGRMPTLFEVLASGGKTDEYINDSGLDEQEDYHQSLIKAMESNPDVFAYIVVTGTKIHYPVTLGSDNSYYLNHDYQKKSSKGGSIFADYTLSSDYKANYNVVMYGHNMGNGSMFRGLKLWFDSLNRNSLADNMEIKVYTKEALYVYKPFSSYRTTGDLYMKTRFSNEKDYKNFLDTIYKQSALRKNITYSATESKVCTLVTCTNVLTNPEERYVLHGILSQVIPYQ